MANSSLTKAKKQKNDEFYTRIEDIEREVMQYQQYFKDKVVYCNCDDPEESNFWKFFELNFEYFGLKKLISTHFDKDKQTYKLELCRDINNDGNINNLDIIKTSLNGNGDFRSPESIELLKEADIVVTNPPFSLFREYIAQLIEYNKKFLIIGNMNAIICKEIFPLIKENKIWIGYGFNKTMEFIVPEGYNFFKELNGIKYGKVPAITWYTNLPNKKRYEKMILFKEFNEKEFQKYDNYIAWNVDKTKDIPVDREIIVQLSNNDYEKAIKIYNDDCQLLDIDKETGICKVLIKRPILGVPISFIDKYNPEQFEIVWQASGNTRASTPIKILSKIGYSIHPEDRGGCAVINNKRLFTRILIKVKS